MPLKNKEFKVDNLEISITQFPAIKGLKIKAKLIRMLLPVVGPMIAPIMESMTSGGTKTDEELLKLSGKLDLEAALPKAFIALAEVLDEDKFLDLIMLLVGMTFVGGKPLTDENIFNEAFSGNYTTLYKLLYEIVMFNHFFDLSGIGLLSSRLINPAPISQEN